VNVSRLRQWLREVKILRNGRQYLLLMKFYLRSLPALVRWRQQRRQRCVASVQQLNADNALAPLHIAFVTSIVSPRECKLAYASRLCGHRVTLIAGSTGPSDVVTQHFDAYYKADNPWQTLILLDELQPDVTHLFVHAINVVMLPVLLYAPSPVVYDPYDCLRGMFKPTYQISRLQLQAERICFARADHVCARSLEPLYLRRQCGYHMPETTYFPEYCWRPPRQCEPRQIRDDDELHVVYSGGVWPEDRYSADTHGYAQYIEVGRALAKQRIHLHIYPAPRLSVVDFENFYSLYLEESKHNPFFHIYHPLPYEELMKVLPRYDAAMHILGITINDALGANTRAKQNYSSTNKLFDYIEAGLPVIIHNGKHQRGIVRNYGTTVEVNAISQIRWALLEAMNGGKCRVAKVDIAQHARRLSDMYVEVTRSCAL
jgi:hypothetical protein